MPTIHFEAIPFTINGWIILKLPQGASVKLPSRGQVMVSGSINDYAFQTALEPDGKGGHWLNIDDRMRESADIEVGDTATLALESTKLWPEPHVPADIKASLDSSPELQSLWQAVTPMARWEWIRWIGATANLETRQHRIEVAASKLKHGMRRPCCFNRSMCCVPEVSKNGMLLEPAVNI
jgi:hypothetical protein